MRRYSTPSTAATSPTASNARSSEMISIRSPGRPLPSHTPALTAMRRSLQSFTPVEGALWTSWAPRRASSRALSAPMTRQLPTAIRSTRRSAGRSRGGRAPGRCDRRGSSSPRPRRSHAARRQRGLGTAGLTRPRTRARASRFAPPEACSRARGPPPGSGRSRPGGGWASGSVSGWACGWVSSSAWRRRLGLAMCAEPKNRRSRHASQALRHGAAPSPNLRLTTPRDTPITVGTGGPTPWT